MRLLCRICPWPVIGRNGGEGLDAAAKVFYGTYGNTVSKETAERFKPARFNLLVMRRPRARREMIAIAACSGFTGCAVKSHHGWDTTFWV